MLGLDVSSFATDEYFQKSLEKEIRKQMSDYTFMPRFSSALYTYSDNYKPFKKEDLIPVKIIYNDKSTVCYFKDGSKEVVHCAEGEEFVKEVGVMSCIMKKLFDTRNEFKRLVESGYTQPVQNKFDLTSSDLYAVAKYSRSSEKKTP